MKELKGVRRSYACLAGWELKANTFTISIPVYKKVKEVALPTLILSYFTSYIQNYWPVTPYNSL